MNGSSAQCILFFAKWPEPGQVKSRLGRDIGDHHAARLYHLFVKDLCAQLDSMDTRRICCYEPAYKRAGFHNWLGPGFDYVAQQGKDLGERMCHAFQWAFSHDMAAAILIGSDSPDLPGDHLSQAFAALTKQDAVIGPCQDGGYYLIGFQRERFLPETFAGVDWSTAHVFEQTKAKLLENGRSLHVLPTWFDIDTQKDLGPLIRRNRDRVFAQSQTYAFVCQNGWHEPGQAESV